MQLLKFTIILFGILLFQNCQILDKPELIPSYIEVSEFSLNVRPGEGSANHKIKDCWVYADSKLIGVFELPAKVPILLNGDVNIQVYPGVYKNGIEGQRVVYPFYTYLDTNLNLKPNGTIKLSPSIGYMDNVVTWLEDFEDPGFKLNQFITNSDTTMFIAKQSQYNDLIEGDAGLIKMSANNVLCEMRTDEPLFSDLPRNLNVPAYFELNYKCNHTFQLGLLDNNSGLSSYNKTTLITFNPTTDESGVIQWNKTYLYIPDVTNFYQNAERFDFFISVFNEDASDGIEVYVDNLKVVYSK